MKVLVAFHRNDDLSDEVIRQTMDKCLTHEEVPTATWGGWGVLSYSTTRKASEVIESWESEGFNIDEFEKFSFTGEV